MNATFHEIHNDQAPRLKTPHFVIDPSSNMRKNLSPLLLVIWYLWVRADLENPLS